MLVVWDAKNEDIINMDAAALLKGLAQTFALKRNIFVFSRNTFICH
jgi:hypothetical protein